MYVPSMASLGVLNPRPTSLYHLFDFVFPAVLGFWKMWGCLRNARSDCTVNSAMVNDRIASRQAVKVLLVLVVILTTI